ncbi:glycosyltransferase family 4 protein [Methylobacillus sp. Pita2]|uniref:glycosyltransferase family 4 protein n=1 Tax=Methylobacillus sp. Pita2 TaxID=3383245 RepID=UPI0038B5F7D9
MIIYINGRFLGRRLTGVDRFALEILRAIDALLTHARPEVINLEFVILVPPAAEVKESFTNMRIEYAGFGDGQVWEQLGILPYLWKRQSLFISLCNTGPVLYPKHLVVIHDAAVYRIPQTFSSKFRLWYKTLMPLLGLTSRHVITVSEFSKVDIAKFFRVPAKKISVISEGGEHIQAQQADVGILEKFNLVAGQYVLAVSSQAPHKNFPLIRQALDHIKNQKIDVAIAGGSNAKIFDSVQVEFSQRVKLLGYVSDAELRALYENAMCFVFPSLYEGFGIPPLEAMYCSCPVFVSDAASIPEVCADAALYFSPTDALALARHIDEVAENPGLRATLAERGKVHASKFTWQQSALSLLDVIEKTRR